MNMQPVDELLNRERLTDLAQSAVFDAHDLWPRIERSVRDLQPRKAGLGTMRRNMVVAFGSVVARRRPLGCPGRSAVPVFWQKRRSLAFLHTRRCRRHADLLVH